MAKKFIEGVDLKAQHGRNGFDVSYQNQFTAPFGMILPFFFQRVNPNDKIKLAAESQTICDGLARPAFMRLREHLDYYFIPATQLWMPFDNFVTGQNSYFSKLVGDKQESKVPSDIPCINLDMIQQLFTDWGSNSETDDLGYDYRLGAVRLFDLLGYFNLTYIAENGGFADMADLGWQGNTQKFNLMPLLAYQKVYYDYFRNPKYEDNFVGAYNIDDYKSGFVLQTLGDDTDTRLKEIFKIHYRWQKKDYFTQTQPNILVDSSQIGYDGLGNYISVGNLFNIPGYIGAGTSVESGGITQSNTGKYVKTGGVTGVTANPTIANAQSNGVSVANIRFAFAYDKLLRRMREAGADFDKQMLAQFGISPYDARHGKCTYIGGYTNALTTKDVTNMTGQEIGELAGQINCYSDNSKRVLKYHAKEHGYIIGVYSTSCDNMYQSYRSSRETLLRNRFDWFNPAFENLGLQPLFEAERDYTGTTNVPTVKGKDFSPNSYTNVIGYVPRYSELKTHVDECHGTLCNYTDIVGMREWNVQMNTDFENQQTLNKTNMLLNPSQFNTVSQIDFDGSQSTDHFVVNVFNHSKKVSNMSMFEDF